MVTPLHRHGERSKCAMAAKASFYQLPAVSAQLNRGQGSLELPSDDDLPLDDIPVQDALHVERRELTAADHDLGGRRAAKTKGGRGTDKKRRKKKGKNRQPQNKHKEAINPGVKKKKKKKKRKGQTKGRNKHQKVAMKAGGSGARGGNNKRRQRHVAGTDLEPENPGVVQQLEEDFPPPDATATAASVLSAELQRLASRISASQVGPGPGFQGLACCGVSS